LTIGELIKNQKEYEMQFENIIVALLECFKDPIPEVSQTADDIIDHVAQLSHVVALEVMQFK
jgi:hypothetical protein